jgi:hypothetical protein
MLADVAQFSRLASGLHRKSSGKPLCFNAHSHLANNAKNRNGL